MQQQIRYVKDPEWFRKTRDVNAQKFGRRSTVLLVEVRAEMEASRHGKSHQ
jgi:hypothetical protein